jgi:hypothetical protein
MVAASLLLPSAAAAAAVEPAAVARTLASAAVYVEPGLELLVDEGRLRYATSVASRAADGAPIKLAFVDVPDRDLNGFRERLYARLDLGERGALVVATPVSITMRTKTLAPITEDAIIGVAGIELRRPPRRYTEALGELVYDTGLVIHNTTPGAPPRGDGADSDLRTFDGRFAGEKGDGSTGLIIALTTMAAALTGSVAVLARRRRRSRR